MTTIMTVVGARPQFVKAAVVSRALRALPDVTEVLVHTGQHYDGNMSDVFFTEMGIPHPDHHLGIGGGTHAQNTGRMLERIEALLLAAPPDWVLVYGDTDSTLAAALAASKVHVPVAHVEAGLRSRNRCMPEEVNRVLTDHVSSLLFAPSPAAVGNLAGEGISGPAVIEVGDVMYDAAIRFGASASRTTVLANLGLEQRGYVLATIHRQENTDQHDRLTAILAGLARSSLRVVLPLHPRTRRRLADAGLALPGNITAIDPVGYLDMLALERNAAVIATDSGGVQKEAFFHCVPCVTLRDETEWVELVEAGANVLVGADSDRISAALAVPPAPHAWPRLYGDGAASQRIAAALARGR